MTKQSRRKQIPRMKISERINSQKKIASTEAIFFCNDEIKKAIPGTIDDAIIAMIVPVITPVIKEELLKLIGKIEA